MIASPLFFQTAPCDSQLLFRVHSERRLQTVVHNRLDVIFVEDSVEDNEFVYQTFPLP